MNVSCCFCNDDAGGTNAVALREPQEEFACSLCIDKIRRGLDPRQNGLF